MTDKYRPEIQKGKHYVVVIDKDEAYKIAKEYDEDEIKLEVEHVNEARNNVIPAPEVIEITDKGIKILRELPSFLHKENSLDTEADTEGLADIFYNGMGKLSKLEELIIGSCHIADGVEANIYAINNATLDYSYMRDLCEEFETAL